MHKLKYNMNSKSCHLNFYLYLHLHHFDVCTLFTHYTFKYVNLHKQHKQIEIYTYRSSTCTCTHIACLLLLTSTQTKRFLFILQISALKQVQDLADQNTTLSCLLYPTNFFVSKHMHTHFTRKDIPPLCVFSTLNKKRI